MSIYLFLAARGELVNFQGECFGTAQYTLIVDVVNNGLVRIDLNSINDAIQICSEFNSEATLASISNRDEFVNARSLIERVESENFLSDAGIVIIGVVDGGKLLDLVERFEYVNVFPDPSYIHSGVGLEPWRMNQPTLSTKTVLRILQNLD